MNCPRCGSQVRISAYYGPYATVACVMNGCWEKEIAGTYLERWINRFLNEEVPGPIILTPYNELAKVEMGEE